MAISVWEAAVSPNVRRCGVLLHLPTRFAQSPFGMHAV
jgi:hypothetical protein